MGLKRWFGRGKAGASTPPRSRALAVELGLWSSVGVLSAVLLAVSGNVMAARFYERWDVTSARLYTLSEPTLETLASLADRVEILVFLSQSDPERMSVRRLLEQYQARSSLIEVRYVDPDRDPATFVALQSRYRLMEGRAEEGRLVSDAALVVVRDESRWVITTDDIVAYDEERGTVQPRLEQAVTEALRQVLDPNAVEICFSGGQLEPSPEDGGPSGLGALRHMLEKNNYVTRTANLVEAASSAAFASCQLWIVAAPEQAFSDAAVQRLLAAVRRGTSVLVSAGPRLGEDQRVLSSGLEPLFEHFGIEALPGLVFEGEPDRVLPVGVGGEVFLAQPRPHDVTRGLLAGREPLRVLMQVSQAFRVKAPAAALLETSEKAFLVNDLGLLAKPGATASELPREAQGAFVVAAAAERAPSSNAKARGPRLVVIGSSSPVLGHTWQDASLPGTRRLIESAVSWLTSRPALVALEPKPERSVELRFTEQSMAEIARYVLLYLPGTALAIGGLILFRRRSGAAARGKPERARSERGGAA